MKNLKDRITIYQVAQAAGVSLATVSRVINSRETVSPATRKKVEETIAALGYKPSGLAQALATNRTTNIGVVIPSANYVYISNILSGITEVAREKNYTLTVFSTSHSREEALSTIDKVITTHVDGAIIFDDQLGPDDVKQIASYNIPTVVIDNKISGEHVCDIHFSYDVAIRNFITSYYENGGDKPMTFLHAYNTGRLLYRSEKVFVRTHEELGKEYKVINCSDSYTNTYHEFLDLFNSDKNLKGTYICYRDSIAAAVENAALDVGKKVPEDIEIVSLVGTKYAYIFRPTITSFHIDMQDAGKRAMYMLTDLLHDTLTEKTARIEPRLYIGQSTIKR